MQFTMSNRLSSCRAALKSVERQAPVIEKAATIIAEAIATGHTVYAAGNGGSAAEAMHFATELSGRYRSNRKPLAGVALGSDGSALSCIANDFGWDEVFSRQLQAHGTPGDVFLAISTSGRSTNIINAANVAKELNLKVIGLLGKAGGDVLPLCDLAIAIDGQDTGAIQEAHLVVIHMLCEFLEPGS